MVSATCRQVCTLSHLEKEFETWKTGRTGLSHGRDGGAVVSAVSEREHRLVALISHIPVVFASATALVETYHEYVS
jgi:hypothetical protein